MIHQLRRSLALDAYDAAIGMIMIGIEAGDSAVVDGRDRRAMRGAERAVTADSVDGLSEIKH